MCPVIKSKSCQFFAVLTNLCASLVRLLYHLLTFHQIEVFKSFFWSLNLRTWASLSLWSFSIFTRTFDCAVYDAELERTSQNPSSPSPGRWPSEHWLRLKRSTPTSWRACTPWAASETRTNWPKICCLRSEWQWREKSRLQNHTWSRLKGWEALRRRREIY